MQQGFPEQREPKKIWPSKIVNLIVKKPCLQRNNLPVHFIPYLFITSTTTTMYKLVFCLLLLGYIGSSSAIEANETALYFQDYTTTPLLSGDQSVLYIYIADTTDLENAKKAIFFPHVDRFTRIEILDSKSLLFKSPLIR
jgi:hypothetical protein